MESAQVADPAADVCTILWSEGYAGMLGAFRREPQKVLIVRTQDPSHRGGPAQVIRVAIAQLSQIPGRYGIDPRKPKLTGDLRRYVLVEIEPDLVQKSTQRPWAVNRCRKISASSVLDRISASIAALFW